MEGVIIEKVLGCFNPKLKKAWEFFPLTMKSFRTRTLALDDPAWKATINPWWQLLTYDTNPKDERR